MEIPISTEIEEPSQRGVFIYTKGFPTDKSIQGIFAFTFYVHSIEDIRQNLYARGISLYEKAIVRAGSVFEGWRIVLYIDRATHKLLVEQDLFVTNPLYECVIVEWPYYNPDVAPGAGRINGDVLRCMRLRAFFDFSTVPVFLRDADTIWSNVVSTSKKTLSVEPETLYQWEANYLEGARKFPNTFLFSTSLGYQRFWHANELQNKKAPLGAFAGLQSTMPVVPCFQDPRLWNEAMDYILKRSIRSERKLTENTNIEKYLEGFRMTESVKKNDTIISYSNELSKIRIGKDEQILIFIFLPKCIDNTFFFELDMFAKRISVTAYESYRSPLYPTIIFKRGSNTNLRNIFITAANEDTLEAKKKAIFQKNRMRKNEKNAALQTFLSNAKGLHESFERESGFALVGKQSILPRAIDSLLKIKEYEDNTLTGLAKAYEDLDTQQFQLKRQIHSLFFKNDPGIAEKKEEYKAVVAQQDKVVFDIVKYLFTKATKEELVSKVDYLNREDTAEFLTGMEKLLAKKGGKRTRKQKRRRMTRKTKRRSMLGDVA